MQGLSKTEVVGQLNENFSKAQAAFVVSYKGCKCSELNTLRNELRPLGAKFAVVKNTLAKRAIEDTDAEPLAEFLSGSTAVIWADEDFVSPAKVVKNFAKDVESFTIKGGVVEGSLVDEKGVDALAAMPSREEVLAKLLSVINAPATKLLRTVNEPGSQLARLLGAWKSELESREG